MARAPAEPFVTVSEETAETSGQRASLIEVESALVRDAVDMWSQKKGARRFPTREDVTPRDMANFLRNVSLFRVATDGSDFQYRVMGDAQVQIWGQSFVGYNSTRLNQIRPGMGDMLRRVCASVARRGEPLVLRGALAKGGHEHINQETVFLPLGPVDSTVDHILSVGWYSSKPKAARPQG